MAFKDLALPFAKTRCAIALGVLALALPCASATQERFDRYGLSPASPTVNQGVQPLGCPSGMLRSFGYEN